MRFLLLYMKIARILTVRKLCDIKNDEHFRESVGYILYLAFVAMTKLNIQKKYLDIIQYKIGGLSYRCFEKCQKYSNVRDLAYFPGVGYARDEVLMRTIVLKNPVVLKGKSIEPGVLNLTFNNTFDYFLENVDIAKLCKEYHIVLEPSWSGYCLPSILQWMKYDAKILVCATEVRDFNFIKSLHSNLKPVSFGASDFVDFRVFKPVENLEKVFDAVYIAVFAPYKRHHVLFRAIKELQDKSFKLALIGVAWKGQREDIEMLIDFYDLHDQVSIFEKITPEEVNIVLNKSKFNLLLSLREGSNRSLFEGLFSGTPAMALDSNVGINKSYINPMTGKLVKEANLSQEMLWMRNNWKQYQTRAWAMENISPIVTTKKIAQELDIPIGEVDEIGKGLAVKVNAPEVKYFRPDVSSSMSSAEDIITLYALHKEPHNS